MAEKHTVDTQSGGSGGVSTGGRSALVMVADASLRFCLSGKKGTGYNGL